MADHKLAAVSSTEPEKPQSSAAEGGVILKACKELMKACGTEILNQFDLKRTLGQTTKPAGARLLPVYVQWPESVSDHTHKPLVRYESFSMSQQSTISDLQTVIQQCSAVWKARSSQQTSTEHPPYIFSLASAPHSMLMPTTRLNGWEGLPVSHGCHGERHKPDLKPVTVIVQTHASFQYALLQSECAPKTKSLVNVAVTWWTKPLAEGLPVTEMLAVDDTFTVADLQLRLERESREWKASCKSDDKELSDAIAASSTAQQNAQQHVPTVDQKMSDQKVAPSRESGTVDHKSNVLFPSHASSPWGEWDMVPIDSPHTMMLPSARLVMKRSKPAADPYAFPPARRGNDVAVDTVEILCFLRSVRDRSSPEFSTSKLLSMRGALTVAPQNGGGARKAYVWKGIPAAAMYHQAEMGYQQAD